VGWFTSSFLNYRTPQPGCESSERSHAVSLHAQLKALSAPLKMSGDGRAPIIDIAAAIYLGAAALSGRSAYMHRGAS
jgi:hypothetical protein